MQTSSTRKLIDIKAPTFRSLSHKAARKGVSLKRYIENLLEESVKDDELPATDGVTDPKILSLIGIAKPAVPLGDMDDDKLQYILSK